MAEKIYDTKRAAEYLGISVATLKDHVYEYKDLAGELMGNSLVLTQVELDRFKATPRRGRGRPVGAKSKKRGRGEDGTATYNIDVDDDEKVN